MESWLLYDTVEYLSEMSVVKLHFRGERKTMEFFLQKCDTLITVKFHFPHWEIQFAIKA